MNRSFMYNPAMKYLCILTVLLAVGCSNSDMLQFYEDRLADEKALSAQVEELKAETAEMADGVEKQERQELLAKVEKNLEDVRVVLKGLEPAVRGLESGGSDTLIVAGETVREGSKAFGGPVEIVGGLIGTLLVAWGERNRRRAKYSKEALSAVQANRKANGDVHAKFNDAEKAVLSSSMSKGAKKMVKEAQEDVDLNLVEALTAVSTISK